MRYFILALLAVALIFVCTPARPLLPIQRVRDSTFELAIRKALGRLSPSYTYDRPSPFVKSINSFGLRFYERVAASRDGNIIVSPFSIYSLLATLAAGADGNTRDELMTTLQCSVKASDLLDSLSSVARPTSSYLEARDGTALVKKDAVWCKPGT